jgi:hypothetical protein
MVYLTSNSQDAGHCFVAMLASSFEAPASYAFGYQFVVVVPANEPAGGILKIASAG